MGLKSNFSLVLPVLFYEYLAISITRSLIPGMWIDAFGNKSYFAVGLVETMKGILAFIACPLFGKLSDRIGRKYCLLVTVTGTTLPVCVLAFSSNMYVFAVMTSISGFFAATFPLTFAYISDCLEQKERAPAYGLALATFGLSFCIGPVSGGYLAQLYGTQSVFMLSLLLTLLNIVYIILILPETAKSVNSNQNTFEKLNVALQYLPNTWNLSETFKIFRRDAFMTNLGIIVFLYYTAVWAVVSTLMIYVTRKMNLSAVAVGYLLSGYGMATMVSESIIVRIVVPWLGETNAMRLGLLSFALQCIVIAASNTVEMIFVSVLFSMFANLVYPSVSSLVSKLVSEEMQGEALGALNGIKALCEGFGPLFFGLLMALYEDFPVPGAPYLLAAFLGIWALLHCYELPPEPGSEDTSSSGDMMFGISSSKDTDTHGVDLSAYMASRSTLTKNRKGGKVRDAREEDRIGLLEYNSDDDAEEESSGAMNKALETSLMSKENVKGIICTDSNGLCIAAKGELNASKAGWCASLVRRAKQLDIDRPCPTIVIETINSTVENNRTTLIKEYDSMTIAVQCIRSDD